MRKITRRDFIDRAGKSALGVAAGSLAGLNCGKPPRKPNIIFIMADDLGYGDLGSYGQRMILTPNIDRLATEGRRFTDFYSGHTVCAPSRCCLMTGKHTGHATRRGNRPYIPLRPDEMTIAEILQSAGYKTGGVGKWGLADTERDFDAGTTGLPNDRGFDYWFGFLNQKHAHNYYPDFVWENKEKYSLEDGEYIHDHFTGKALDFIRQNRNDPFFLYVAYTIPHVNNEVARETGNGQQIPSDEPYTTQPWPQVERNFAAMITRMDLDVGSIMQLLDDLGLTDDTIIFFTSDNGAQNVPSHRAEFFNSAGGLRGLKGNFYEGGIRVPMIVRWPGRIEAGSVSNQVWAFWDFLPTAAEIAGGVKPADIDGISMLPALIGQPQQDHEYLYWEDPRKPFLQAVRAGDWKAVRNGVDLPIELYNLATDVTEHTDVADQHPEIVARMRETFKTARTYTEHWPISLS